MIIKVNLPFLKSILKEVFLLDLQESIIYKTLILNFEKYSSSSHNIELELPLGSHWGRMNHFTLAKWLASWSSSYRPLNRYICRWRLMIYRSHARRMCLRLLRFNELFKIHQKGEWCVLSFDQHNSYHFYKVISNSVLKTCSNLETEWIEDYTSLPGPKNYQNAFLRRMSLTPYLPHTMMSSNQQQVLVDEGFRLGILKHQSNTSRLNNSLQHITLSFNTLEKEGYVWLPFNSVHNDGRISMESDKSGWGLKSRIQAIISLETIHLPFRKGYVRIILSDKKEHVILWNKNNMQGKWEVSKACTLLLGYPATYNIGNWIMGWNKELRIYHFQTKNRLYTVIPTRLPYWRRPRIIFKKFKYLYEKPNYTFPSNSSLSIYDVYKSKATHSNLTMVEYLVNKV